MGVSVVKIFQSLFYLLISIFLIMQSNIGYGQDGSAFVATEPLIFSQGMPSTFVTVGNKTIPLLLDTGASRNSLILTKAALKNFAVTYTGKIHCMTALDKKYCMKEFVIPMVKVGNFVLHNVPGEEMITLWGGHTEGFIQTESSRNGVLGLNFLKQFNVLIDYKQHEITYQPFQTYPSNLDLASCHSAKTNFVNGIVASYSFNNRINKLVLDSGSTVSLIKPAYASKNLLPCDESHVHDFKNCRIDRIRLFSDQKSQDFYLLPMNLSFFDGIIGSTYIQNHKIFIDSFNKLVYLC